MRRLVEPYIIANVSSIYQAPEALPKPELSRFFGNRLAVLKAPAGGGEKGVLFVMVSDMFRLLHAGMNLPKLLEDYTLVFEPSWSGYCHPELLEYTRWNQETFILAAEEYDFGFLKRLNSNLIPVDLGPCDWVDPRVATPYLANPKEFDIVMNSNWGAWKRHHVLFRMLRNAKQRYNVVLIGVNWSGKTRADIERLASFFGVVDQIVIFEHIPYEQVMDLTCRSRVSILLSLKEGSNRAIAESIFCNLPVVTLSSHVGGIRKNVVPETGLIADERHLEFAISRLLRANLNPREWGLENVSCFKSSEKLNLILREHALRQGRPWTQDIAGRSNSPESKYLYLEDAERLAPWNEALKNYMR
jgi:glycosyltransferase involved in cell wall biosynthesis